MLQSANGLCFGAVFVTAAAFVLLPHQVAESCARTYSVENTTTKAPATTKTTTSASVLITSTSNVDTLTTSNSDTISTSSTTTSSNAATTTAVAGSPSFATYSCGVNQYNNGIVTGSGIVGGTAASTGWFPWQAALSIRATTGSYLCGGSLVHANWVLTAAHCCSDAASNTSITVLLGSNSIKGPFSYSKASQKIFKHPSFTTANIDPDVCLIQIPTVTFSSVIRPICLPSYTSGQSTCDTSTECSLNEYAMTSGWGLNSTSGSVQTNLQVLQIQIRDPSLCSNYYGRLSSSMVCVGGVANQGTCYGDSGGPLMCLRNGKYVISGVTSFGTISGCAVSGVPSVFSRICATISWIRLYVPY